MTPPETTPADPPPTETARPPATLASVTRAVFWSFFGVRKGEHMRQDAATIKPLHLVVVGLLAGLAFVLALITLVALVMRYA